MSLDKHHKNELRFTSEEAREKALDKAYLLLSNESWKKRKLQIGKSDLNPEFTKDVEAMFNECLFYLDLARMAIDQIDSPGTNYRDLESDIHEYIDVIQCDIQSHELWTKLNFWPDREWSDELADCGVEVSNDEAMKSQNAS